MKKRTRNKVIAIIPARGGSKRLVNKNIQSFDGKPLIQYSIEYAKLNTDIIDKIVVTTDDEKIKEIALGLGVDVIDRPNELSGDLEPTVSALKHVLETIDYEVENVILLQATNPIRPKTLLEDAFKIFTNNNHSSLFTVTQNQHKLGKIKDDKYIPFNYEIGQRSQDLDPLYYENGLLYITKSNLILDNIIISEDAYPMIINHPSANIDIDTKEDLEYAEYIYTKYKNE